MLCSQATELFSPHLDEELPSDSERDLLDHLSACTQCTRGFFTLRHALAALKTLPERATEDLPQRIMQAMGQPMSLTPQYPARPWPKHWRRTTTVLAATLACVVGLTFALSRKPSPSLEVATIETANTKLREVNAALSTELANEHRHRNQGEIWLNGAWRPHAEALPLLTAEQGLVPRHGLLVDHQTLDAMEAGKVLKNGQWLSVNDIVTTHLTTAGLSPEGRSWLADEDRHGMLVEGRRTNEDMWLSQILISKGYEQGADGNWRPVGDKIATAPVPAATPPVREPTAAETAATLALAQIRQEQQQWQSVFMLPRVPSLSTSVSKQMLTNLGAEGRSMKAVAGPNKLTPVAFTSPTGLTGWRVTITQNGQLGTPAITSRFVHVGGGLVSSSAFAFDRVTGKPRWSTTFGDNGPSSPAVIDDDVAYTTDSCTLYQLDGDSGKSLFVRWISGSLNTMPSVIDTMLVTTTPLNGGFALVGFDRTANSKKRWATVLTEEMRTAPIAIGGQLVGVTNSGTVMCWKAADGQELWRNQLGAISPPSSAHGKIVVRRALQRPSQNGVIYGEALSLLDASNGTIAESMVGAPSPLYDTASLATSYPVPLLAVGANIPLYPALGPAVTAQGITVAVHGDVMEATTVKDGLKAWQVQLGRTERAPVQTHSDLCIAGNCVVIGTLDGQLLAIDLMTGTQRWSVQLGVAIGNSCTTSSKTMCRVRPVVQDGRVYITTTAGELVCVDSGDRTLNGACWWGDSL